MGFALQLLNHLHLSSFFSPPSIHPISRHAPVSASKCWGYRHRGSAGTRRPSLREPCGVCLKRLTYAEGECGDEPRSWTTAPSTPREPPSQVSRDVLRYRAGLCFGCRPSAVLSRKSGASSPWLFSAQLRSPLGHLEPRSLFNVAVRAAGGGRAGDGPRPGAAGGGLSPGAPRPGGRVGAWSPSEIPSEAPCTRAPRTLGLDLEGWDRRRVQPGFIHPGGFVLYLLKESRGLGVVVGEVKGVCLACRCPSGLR